MSIWDALDEGHGAAPFDSEPSAYEQHMAAERQKRELKSQIKRFGDDAMRVDPTLPLGASGAAVAPTEQFERGYVMRMPGSRAPKQESKDPLRSLLKAMQITGNKSRDTGKSDGSKSSRTTKAGESDDAAAGGVQFKGSGRPAGSSLYREPPEGFALRAATGSCCQTRAVLHTWEVSRRARRMLCCARCVNATP